MALSVAIGDFIGGTGAATSGKPMKTMAKEEG
jgi:hypothetical protein